MFDRWNALGWAGFVVLLIGLSLIGLGIGSELRGLAALRRVDQLRDEFASGETDRVQRAARRWLERLPQHSEIVSALAAADTPEFVLASRVPGRCKRYRTRRMYSGGPPLFKASRSLQRPLRLQWTC